MWLVIVLIGAVMVVAGVLLVIFFRQVAAVTQKVRLEQWGGRKFAEIQARRATPAVQLAGGLVANGIGIVCQGISMRWLADGDVGLVEALVDERAQPLVTRSPPGRQ